MQQDIVIGLDTGKDVFHVWEADRHGGRRVQRRFSRRGLLRYLANHEPALIGLETGGGAHHMARTLQSYGHTARLMAAQHVRAYVKASKNDLNDAEGAWEAVQRPTMRYVAVKTVEQQELGVLLGAREQAGKHRTKVSNHIRGVLREFGVVLPGGVGVLRRRLPEVLEDADNALPARVREVLAELGEELARAEQRYAHYTRQVHAVAREREDCRRLMEIPGIGAVVATATVAKVGDAKQFRKGRDVSAWMGIVPRQHSTGGKPRLGHITKHGDGLLRTVYIHGGRSVLRVCERRDDALSRWARAVKVRRGWNVATVAVANKLARIAWAVLANDTCYDPRRAAR